MKVLLVEDNAALAMAIQDELELAGYDVLGPAYSAQHARQLILGTELDGAIIDIDLLDGRTGGDLAKELKYSHACPTVFATGQTHMAAAWQNYAIGALSKPYHPEVVVRTVRAMQAMRSGLEPIWPRQFQLFME